MEFGKDFRVLNRLVPFVLAPKMCLPISKIYIINPNEPNCLVRSGCANKLGSKMKIRDAFVEVKIGIKEGRIE